MSEGIEEPQSTFTSTPPVELVPHTLTLPEAPSPTNSTNNIQQEKTIDQPPVEPNPSNTLNIQLTRRQLLIGLAATTGAALTTDAIIHNEQAQEALVTGEHSLLKK